MGITSHQYQAMQDRVKGLSRARPSKKDIAHRLALEKVSAQIQAEKAGRNSDSHPKRSKYGNKKVIHKEMLFDSRKEFQRYLELAGKPGRYLHLERQKQYRIEVNGQLICKYIADFVYYDTKKKDWITEDVKGFRRGSSYAIFRLKKKLIFAVFGIEISEV